MEADRKLGFRTADQVLSWDRVSTGCENIDSILRGGIPFNGITEIYGSSGVGKTQLLLQLAITIQLPEHYGGKERGAAYICTEDVFPAKRFHQLAQHFKQKYNLSHMDFESNMYIYPANDFEQLRRCVSVQLLKLLREKNIGLVIIDSIAGAFRSENFNLNYTSRGQDIINIADKMNTLGDKHKLAVVCANQITQVLDTNKEEPCLGLVWSNNITYRIRISRYNSNPSRTLKVMFAPDLPNSECSFFITDSGITAE